MGRVIRLSGTPPRSRRSAAGSGSVGAPRGGDGPVGIVPTENVEQEKIVEYLKSKVVVDGSGKIGTVMIKPEGGTVAFDPTRTLWDYSFAIPNGQMIAGNAAQRARYMAALKRRGLRPGVFDIMVAYPREPYHGLFVEMKRRKGSVTSDDQRSFAFYMREVGYKCVIAKGYGEAQMEIEQYLVGVGSHVV